MNRHMLLKCDRLEWRLAPTGTPLPDLGPGQYQGYQGSLYANGEHAPPAAHLAKGVFAAQNLIKPLNSAGQIDVANGKIVMISVGMSNTTQEFGSTANSFKVRADADNSKNPQLMIVDGAQGGQDAGKWVNPAATTWTTLNQRLTNAGVTAAQVEVAWIKQADANPNQYGAFPAHAQHLQDELETIARNLKTLYPNIRMAFVSSRTMSYNNNINALNPEPFAFESGFATQWLINKQTSGDPTLNFDPALGPAVAPYLAWGPYLWVDGANPRSDGLTWLTSDLQADLTHPSANGVLKVSDQLLSFFKTDPTAAPWFSRTTVVGQPPSSTPTADKMQGFAPLTVQFNAQASDTDGTIRETAWTFDDGTSSRSSTPTKVFINPGTYITRLAVVDSSGNPITRSMTITVNPAPTAMVTIGDGTAQRSRVTSLTVTFSQSVTLPANLASAFTLIRQSDNASVGLDAVANGNSVVLTFVSGPVEFGSLADGRYSLTAIASQINGGSFDGNGDGIAGDNLVLASATTPNPPTNIFRLFGDSDGDGTVAANDFIQFRLALGGTGVAFDFDNDGAVAASDFIQFRLRFGGSI